MRGQVLFICFMLAGCSGYSEIDLEIARDEGHALAEAEAKKGIERAYTEAYEEGYEDGITEGYALAEEDGKERIEEAYSEGIAEGLAMSRSDSNNLNGSLGDISDSIQGNLNTFGTPSIDMDGYDWRFLLVYDKRELIEAIAENKGEYLSRDEVDHIMYLIDGYYENGMKYKTVGEVLEEL